MAEPRHVWPANVLLYTGLGFSFAGAVLAVGIPISYNGNSYTPLILAVLAAMVGAPGVLLGGGGGALMPWLFTRRDRAADRLTEVRRRLADVREGRAEAPPAASPELQAALLRFDDERPTLTVAMPVVAMPVINFQAINVVP